MNADKRRRHTDSATSEIDFFLRGYDESSDEMLLFGRDTTGGTVCIRMPPERTLYLLRPPTDQTAPPTGQTAPPPQTLNISGFESCETRTLECAFPHQGAPGQREWHVVTYRSAQAAPRHQPGYECGVASTTELVEAFLIARRIKSTRWLQTQGAQLVQPAHQLTRCHAEYKVADISESPSAASPPAIVVLRIGTDGSARIEQINSADGTCIELECGTGDIARMVALHDPDVVHGNIDMLAQEAQEMVRFRDKAGRIRRANLDNNKDDDNNSVWHANLVAQACGSPLSSAVCATSVSCHFALLHAMAERGFLPVLPERRSLPPPTEPLTGGKNLETVPGIYHSTVQLYDFRSLYPSVVLEKHVDLRTGMHQPLLPAVMSKLVDARRHAPTPAHAKAFKECANTLIGCFAQRTNRLYCPSVNQRINGCGREALNRAVAIARKEKLGLVIAGQTDSLLLACTGDPAQTEQRLLAAVNKDYTYMQLALSTTWTSVFMSAKKNRYAALDPSGHLTIKGLLDKTQSAQAQQAIEATALRVLTNKDVAFDAETLALPAAQREKICTTIAELCNMAAAMDESDVRRKLNLDLVTRAAQRVASAPLFTSAGFGAAANDVRLPDHTLRPGVASADAAPPPVIPIEDLCKQQHRLPLCLAASAAAIADTRADAIAPKAYPHMQHAYMALRSFGLAHDASRDVIVRSSPHSKQRKRAATVNGMRQWPHKEFARDKQRRGGDERAASCLWACAASAHCAFKKKSDAATRRALLAQRGVCNSVDEIERLVALGEHEAACACEFQASHGGRVLNGGKPTHPALYAQQSFVVPI